MTYLSGSCTFVWFQELAELGFARIEDGVRDGAAAVAEFLQTFDVEGLGGFDAEYDGIDEVNQEVLNLIMDDNEVGGAVGDVMGEDNQAGHRSASDYIAHERDMLFPGSPMTVGQYCYTMMELKREGTIRDTSMDKILRVISCAVLPPVNNAPPSYHLLKKVLKVEDPHAYEHHVCVNGCMRFPQTPKSQWNEADVCQECLQPRFEKTRAGVLKPRKVGSVVSSLRSHHCI